MPIDSQKEFKPINISVLTISDTRTEATDKSGQILANKIKEKGHSLKHKEIVIDDKEIIKSKIQEWCNNKDVDVIIATGGTGLTGRDTTPEAVSAIASKHIDGWGELFRQVSFEKIGTSAIQSRAVAALINSTYVFCLPGSTGACKDGWDEILQYQLDIRHKPCNFVEIMPRLNEK